MKNEHPAIEKLQSMVVDYVLLSNLKPLGRDLRKHTKRQLKKLKKSLIQFGCVLPILITQDYRIIDGAAVVYVAKKLKWVSLPCVYVDNLTSEQLRILRLALNRIIEDAQWNLPELKLEFQELFDIDTNFDVELAGFDMGEIDLLLTEPKEDRSPLISTSNEAVVSRLDDCFVLDQHRVLCADAQSFDSFDVLMQGKRAQQVFTDAPYNLPIQGMVSGNGKITHDEFAMACGEMPDNEYSEFLHCCCQHMIAVSALGALHYMCIDWRHMRHLLEMSQDIYSSLMNVCVWVKNNGGMGSFYRSRHELIFVFKIDESTHINNIELGVHRYRTNVWEYDGCSSFSSDRDAMLSMHPTAKNLQLVEDAILDASNRGDIVLDPFLGSGTTILACENTGRIGYGMEIDPQYVDVTIRRWQDATKQDAIHESSGLTFNELMEQRKEPDHE